jgi:hypothetical protein
MRFPGVGRVRRGIPMRPKMRDWRAIYVTAALICVAIALIPGASDDSHAWHAGVIILIIGILLLWRFSEPS